MKADHNYTPFALVASGLMMFLLVSCGSGTEAAPAMDPELSNTHAETAAKESAEPAQRFSATRGIEPLDVDWEEFRTVSAEIGEELSQAAFGTGWLFTVDFAADPESGDAKEPAAGSISFYSNRGDRRTMELRLAPFDQKLYYNEGSIGFLPVRVEVGVEKPVFIEGLYLEPGALDSFGTAAEMVPLSADPGVILQYDYRNWRLKEYELFRWNLVPDVLIFEFNDYAIQREFFTRLAFFVGVTGESGKIEEEAYYEGRHVFNAHDYRPEDIAAFYLLAEERGIELNSAERLLRDIALHNGVLRMEGGRLSPGKGAILSIARELPGYLRRRLLSHEAMHGLFYALPSFREGNFRIFRSMEEHEKAFWTLFLANKGRLDGRQGYAGYDVDNEYLLVNEILGHMMQLLPHEVNPYFLDVYLTRMEQRFPEEKELFRYIRREDPGMFTRTRRAMEELLQAELGYIEGDIYGTASMTTEKRTTEMKELEALLEKEDPEIATAILNDPQWFLELMERCLDSPEIFFTLVDKEHALPEDFVPPDLVQLSPYVTTMENPFTLNRNDLSVSSLILDDLHAMVDAARADGVELVLSSTYRSWEYQEGLYNRYVASHGKEAADRFSAQPGHSQHQLGTVIDFGSITPEFADSDQGKWMTANAWKYGFSLSYPEAYEELTGYMYEPWHFRYISPTGAALEREFFGGIQQHFLEFFHRHREFFRSMLQGGAEDAPRGPGGA